MISRDTRGTYLIIKKNLIPKYFFIMVKKVFKKTQNLKKSKNRKIDFFSIFFDFFDFFQIFDFFRDFRIFEFFSFFEKTFSVFVIVYAPLVSSNRA